MSHHTFVGGGGIEIEQLHKGGTEIEKNDFSSKPLLIRNTPNPD